MGEVDVPGVAFGGGRDVDFHEGIGGPEDVEVGFEVYDVVVEGAGDGGVDAVAVFGFAFRACKRAVSISGFGFGFGAM